VETANGARRVLRSERGVTLTKEVLFDGCPRKLMAISFVVRGPRKPEGRSFGSKNVATKFLNVQVAFGPKA
jgi:hypothetical protein